MIPVGRKEREQFFSFMDGYSSMAGDLPDGAWQGVCEEGVKAYNAQYKTKYDPHAAWLLWVAHNSSISAGSGGKP